MKIEVRNCKRFILAAKYQDKHNKIIIISDHLLNFFLLPIFIYFLLLLLL